MKEFLKRNILIYVLSLLLPALAGIPWILQHWHLGRWGIAGLCSASIVAIVIFATTLRQGIRKNAMMTSIILLVVIAGLAVVSKWIPIPPVRFFGCYYAVDSLAILVSIAINWLQSFFKDSQGNRTSV